MINVQSYLKSGERFIPIDQFKGNIPDPNYIEGAIELNINSTRLLTTVEWDYVDQLWGYLIGGLEAVKRGDPFETYFPDQPIKVTFTPSVDKRTVQVSVTVDDTREARIPRDEFVRTMGNQASHFFNQLGRLLPENKPQFDPLLKRIDSLT